ncbi:helix-turn-helix transcriptional regulator [Streptomyces sp. NPDC093249]|uniref:helix-turn-helix transcriptional regulator n=1 Tax=unclassified Streptomyces TaxID=2593676 RepID=UPI00383040BC
MAELFAQLLLQLRKKDGRSQEQQAEAVNAVSGRVTVTRREISRYEHGETIPTNHTLGHIAVASGVPYEELLREAKAARIRRAQARRRGEQDEEDMKRRTVLEGAVLGATAVAAEPWGRLAAALRQGSRVDEASANTLIARTADLHIQELNLSAQPLQHKVESHLDAITAVLPRAGRHERALTIAAGETAALAGWVAWDLGEHTRANAYYKVASECAASAGQPPLRALALTYASYGNHDPKGKLGLLRQAAQDVRGHGNAAAAAWVHGRYAEEAALLGDFTEALKALDRARFAYDFADHTSEQAWVRFVTPYRMDSLTLSVYGQLRRVELTITADDAIARLGGGLPEGGVVVLGDLAIALLRGGNIDQALDVSRAFAAAAQAKPNTMGKDRARAVAALLPAGERDLAHHLRELAA